MGKYIFTWGNKRPRRLVWAVGIYTVGYQLVDMAWATFQHMNRDTLNVSNRYGKDSWVIISGASDPLGREFAKKFGNKGFNLMLVD